MRSRPSYRSVTAAVLLLAAGIAGAQSSDGSVSSDPAIQVPRQTAVPQLPEAGISLVPQDLATLKLEPGTLIRFSVYDAPEMSASLRVAPDGSVNVPLAGVVQVGGMTLPEARQALEAALLKGEYFVHPQVSLDVAQVAPAAVTMTGEVHTPGRFQILSPISLQAALAQAGGETENAGVTIDIHRAKAPADVLEHVSNARADQNAFNAIQIAPGDSVDVRRAGVIYVLGAVHRPGGFMMLNRGSLDVMEALALAQGTLLEAATGSIRILHRNGDGFTEEKFELDPSTKGKRPTLALHDTDIVYVPPSFVKTILVNGSSIIGAATSSIIYRVY
ncbi:polysaccharide export outer membrane protein [Bryocella elongata]|uniref:Polysaccharide export outer membrane protein n=1 Tax=Bryocella elongata TaxID=863522 RepID=A0A1H5SSC6_9BACT|nr:polysaccharide biosynthesis/export family protein [Bryocella elongata]SEF52888.1 polysaccharide export outer membrane protein [Bryocella elongata]